MTKTGCVPALAHSGGNQQPMVVEVEAMKDVAIVDDLYHSRGERVFAETAPSIRAERSGLKVTEVERISTNGTEVSGTIRATYYKNGERNIAENIENGRGYEGIIVAMRGRNPEKPSDRSAGIVTEQRLEPNASGTTNTLTSVQKDNLVLETAEASIECAAEIESGDLYTLVYQDEEWIYFIRIRKLTPRECWRLMGFSDLDFDKAADVNSNTQLYKQAGNSIVKNVLVAIVGQFFEGCEEFIHAGIIKAIVTALWREYGHNFFERR